MKLIRTQDNVPSCYLSESRDFQLLCRLYDCIINGVKFDNDSIINVIDTDRCSDRVLQLLQSKLGFFTNEDLTDDDIRKVLRAFPVIIRNKGSKKAIEQALYVYLKINGINTDIDIKIINKDAISPYTIQIGIRSSLKDTRVLDEIFKYILPSGYVFSYIFYTSIKETDDVFDNILSKVVYTDDTRSSRLRNGSEKYSDSTVNAILGAIDTTEVIGSDNTEDSDNPPEPIVTDATCEFDFPAYYSSTEGEMYYTKYSQVVEGSVTSGYADPVEHIVNQIYVDKDTGNRYKFDGKSFELQV